jgi:hypothetical protein
MKKNEETPMEENDEFFIHKRNMILFSLNEEEIVLESIIILQRNY